jgi:hypothetical protein
MPHEVVTSERGVAGQGRRGYMAQCVEPECGEITFGGFRTRTDAREALRGHEEAPDALQGDEGGSAPVAAGENNSNSIHQEGITVGTIISGTEQDVTPESPLAAPEIAEWVRRTLEAAGDTPADHLAHEIGLGEPAPDTGLARASRRIAKLATKAGVPTPHWHQPAPSEWDLDRDGSATRWVRTDEVTLPGTDPQTNRPDTGVVAKIHAEAFQVFDTLGRKIMQLDRPAIVINTSSERGEPLFSPRQARAIAAELIRLADTLEGAYQ